MSMFGPAFDAEIAYTEERRTQTLAASRRRHDAGDRRAGAQGRPRLLDRSPLAMLVELFDRRTRRARHRRVLDVPYHAR